MLKCCFPNSCAVFLSKKFAMLERTDIEKQLNKLRSKRISSEDLLSEVHRIFAQNDAERSAIGNVLSEKNSGNQNSFTLDLLESDQIYSLEDIRKLCVDYRLRFLDSHFFKGEIPEEAITKIRMLEKQHQTSLKGFKVVAPAKLLKLENADDPMLFAPMGNDYFYLIHKWGNDLHPLRKLLMWPYKSFENLVFTVFVLSIFLTSIMPIELFSKNAHYQEYLMLFLFIFKGVGGMVLFYGFAKGKNFNTAIWNSKYYNA